MPKPQESLKIVEVSPTSIGLDTSQKMFPMNVVTRAQKLKNAEVQTVDKEKPAESSKNSWEAWQERRATAQKRREEKAIEDTKVQESNEKPKEGSIFAEQILEPLKAMLDAFEPRLRPQQTLEEIIRAYSDHALETKCLEIFQEMIKGTQALLEKQIDKPIFSLEKQTTSSRHRRKTRSKKAEELILKHQLHQKQYQQNSIGPT